MATASVTADFALEFEAERTAWFRKRFLWYTGLFAIIGLLSVLGGALMVQQLPESARTGYTWLILIGVAQSLLYPAAFIYVKSARGGLPRPRMIVLVFWLLVINAVLGLPAAVIATPMNRDLARTRLISGEINERLEVIEGLLRSGRDDPAGVEGRTTVHDAGRRMAIEQGLLEDDGGADLPVQRAPESIGGAEREALQQELVVLKGIRTEVVQRGFSGEAGWQAILARLPGAIAEPLIDHEGDRKASKIGPGVGWLLNVMAAHFIAAFFIPWTWREALAPLIPVLALNVVGTAIGGDLFTLSGIGFVLLSPLIGVPGVAVVAIRNAVFQKRFTYRALRGRYTELKRELGLARQIHEDLFPPPIDEGPIRLSYHYEPMRQIGGDYLHARLVIPHGRERARLHLIVMDVTGHGISAALTVNRLHGEMDRLLAENPDLTPGQMLTGLNRYMHATLAGHSVYATALCVAADPDEGVLRWASAGHPPAFLRQVNGRIEELHSTTFVLGVTLGDDFDADEQQVRFRPGDTLLAYTDGAIEIRNANNRQLGVSGLLSAFANGKPSGGAGSWPAWLAERVRQYRVGPSQDDILLVELYCPLD